MSGNPAWSDESDHQKQGDSHLTERELEVISLLVRGGSNAEIAAALGLSERTIYSLVDSIKQKLGLVTRAELLRYVREHGIL